MTEPCSLTFQKCEWVYAGKMSEEEKDQAMNRVIARGNIPVVVYQTFIIQPKVENE